MAWRVAPPKIVLVCERRHAVAAARALATGSGVDALFLSCTNLRTLDAIPVLASELRMPVLSSNLVLAWEMLRLAGAPGNAVTPQELL